MSATFAVLLRRYLGVLLAGLLLHGLVSLAFRLAPALAAGAPYLVRGVFGIDIRHAWLHILWGGLGGAALARWRSPQAAIWLALAFGVFYTALGVAGVAIHHPFGLELGLFENAFHLVSGPATLLLGALGAISVAHGRTEARLY